jgi:hypothetical protein
MPGVAVTREQSWLTIRKRSRAALVCAVAAPLVTGLVLTAGAAIAAYAFSPPV